MNQNLPEQKEDWKILVVDDHETTLIGTTKLLKEYKPKAEIVTAKTVQDARIQIEKFKPELVVMDLYLPETSGGDPKLEHGIKCLKELLKKNLGIHVVVLSSYIEALVRIKPDIEAYEGGFTVADKGFSNQEILKRVELALHGVTHTKDLKMPSKELKLEWIEVLNLAFEEGLEDGAIAERMQVSTRTVRHYWSKIQDVLEVYPENGKSLRIQTQKRAREEGFID